jgi:ubiquinone/menaquinone biosynthesis C-methylase UbiE
MNGQTFWNRFADKYDFIIRKDAAAYRAMYRQMADDLRPDMEVLELATGTGLIALNVAERVRSIEATDFSPAMIAEAKKKPAPGNVTFSVQDAMALTYAPGRFDAVIISNALHILPDPVLALENIRRVLKEDGLLIAPTYARTGGAVEWVQSALMGLAGFRTYTKWTPETYCAFLADNGFAVLRREVIPASFPLVYTVAKPHPSSPNSAPTSSPSNTRPVRFPALRSRLFIFSSTDFLSRASKGMSRSLKNRSGSASKRAPTP